MDNALLISAIHAAQKASLAILSVYEGAIEVEYKADDSPLTEADKRAQAAIEEELFPWGIPMLSEESADHSYENRKDWDRFWLVDPLDGTKEFIKRNGEFTVNIALVSQGKPIGGVVFVPVKNWLYIGWPGLGSWKFEHADALDPAQIVPNPSAHGKKLPFANPEVYTVVASRSHLNAETTAYLEKLEAEHKAISLVSVGSSLKLNFVAEGTAHEYPRFGPTMEWDTAAGHAVALYAGCEVEAWPAKTPLVYNKENLLNPFFRVWRKYTP